jgi:hypothetical protein
MATDTLPVLDLSLLTAADLRTVIALERATGLDKTEMMLDLLERVTVGGLAAIPLAHLRAYQDRLGDELKAVLDPKP